VYQLFRRDTRCPEEEDDDPEEFADPFSFGPVEEDEFAPSSFGPDEDEELASSTSGSSHSSSSWSWSFCPYCFRCFTVAKG